ncbi:signal peptide-containing protein [Babesia caballi]|uniref:Signal peptide-containing protein n=1 Tax=Babesia caballi TaxID=5871 RepID=A0AAV4LWY9_BABCB|nr:signal peptide-containing protein [Babesia caballi]
MALSGTVNGRGTNDERCEDADISGDAEDIASSFINLLENDGFQFQNKNDLKALASFLEAFTDGSVAKRDNSSPFLNMLKHGSAQLLKATKEFTKNNAKGMIGQAVKLLIVTFLQKGLPAFENIYESAMQKVPIDIRITYAPMAYTMWTELFKKLKIDLPEDFNVERFICKAMTKEQCDGVIMRIMERKEKLKEAAESQQLRRRQGRNASGDDDYEDYDEDSDEDSGLDFDI